MTVQPIDTEALRRLADRATPGPWEVSGSLVGIGRAKPNIGQTWGLRWRQDIEFICAARTAIPQLLDQLDRAEHRIARLEAQTDIRGRAVVMYRERAREAEAERDEWRQTALDERAAALDALEQIKVRDTRIKAVLTVVQEWESAEVRHEVAPIMRAASTRIRRALEG